MKPLRMLMLALLLPLAGCVSSSSWDPAGTPPDPLPLPDELDELSAIAYYNHGQRILEQSPSKAAQAFYWASKLDPTWADPLYARRMALLMSNTTMFQEYLRGSRRMVESPGAQRLDSLYLRALVLNPFLLRRQDAVAFRYVIVQDITRDPRNRMSEMDVQFAVDRWLRDAPPRTRAWLAQSEHRLSDAAELYEQAKARDGSAEVLADLARVYFLMGRSFDARQTMAEAIDLLHERDEQKLVRLYNSKALFEYSLGMILERIGEQDEARQAYARALQEDLAYHPAHMRLGEMALTEGDTLTALSEMALAADIGATDAGVLLRYGRVLAGAGQHHEAAQQYRRAVEIEPHFAQPLLELARALEAAGDPAAAAAEYRAFTEKAARSDPGLAVAERRLRVLETAVASPSGQ